MTGDRMEREELKVRYGSWERRGGERNRITAWYGAEEEEAEQQGQGAGQRARERKNMDGLQDREGGMNKWGSTVR